MSYKRLYTMLSDGTACLYPVQISQYVKVMGTGKEKDERIAYLEKTNEILVRWLNQEVDAAMKEFQ